jgi:FtsP/CotA-like multicopper oxidase with cupredoxin domain
VNGIVAPAISIRPDEAQFWQIGNIGADRFLRLKIDGMPFYLIGRDGYFVPRPIRMEEVLLAPPLPVPPTTRLSAISGMIASKRTKK